MTDDPAVTPPPSLTPGRIAWGAADILFGIIAPVLCLAFDPVVFRGGLMGAPVLVGYTIVGYTSIGLGLVAFPVWLAIGRPAGVLSGVLAGGAVFAACLGLVLLPTTLIGLIVCIGVFGLTPFATAVVFGRNARRAWAKARAAGQRVALVSAAAGFLVACGGPWAAWAGFRVIVDGALADIRSGDPAAVGRGAATLRRLGFLAGENYDAIVWEYYRERDPVRREALARAYQTLTGEDIDHRLRIVLD